MVTDSFSEIGNRANILHKYVSSKEVVIYEDHRTILNVLHKLKEANKIDSSLNLIMFDAHDDFCNLRPNALSKIKGLLKGLTDKKLSSFVEFELNGLDDDWVKAGMELGLIGDCILFNSTESSIRLKEEYETKDFGKKKFFNLGEVWSTMGSRGCLGDIVRSDEYKELWESLDWEYSNDNIFDFKKERKKYVFDIDLDCFTTKIFEKTVAIPQRILNQKFKELRRSDTNYYTNSLQFVKRLIEDAELVTICMESDYCGGIREAQDIFNSVDLLFFDGELGKGKF
ncbi:MAG: hypothetical protein ABI763_05370 [Bacteroidota bacterium]